MIIYTSVFTPKDNDISSNNYIRLIPIWLSFLLRNGDVKPEDTVVILIDQDSYKYIIEDKLIKNDIDLYSRYMRLRFLGYDRPNTLAEGMVKRYAIVEDTFCVYLDIDCLVKKPLRQLFEGVVENSEGAYIEKDGNKIGNFMFISSEGELLHKDYGGSVLEEGTDKAKYMSGFTSAIFGYSPCSQVEEFFNSIVKQTLEKNPPLATFDLPFYNKEVAERLLLRKPCDIYFQKISGFVSLNDIGDSNAYILNLAGIPGNSDFHYNKAVSALAALYCASKDKEPKEPEKPKDVIYI